jgi:hypothetical protein
MALLTPDEMIEVTGAQIPSKQIEVLEDNRIGYIKRINGHPTTTWEAINARLTKDNMAPPTISSSSDGFDLQAIG